MGFGRINLGRSGGLPTVALAVICLLLAGTAGCTLKTVAHPDNYRVQRGDTLYSIATRYDLNWRDVARWNHIRAPYTISTGQILSLERYPTIPYPQRGVAPVNNPVAKKKPRAARTQQPAKTAPRKPALVRKTPAVIRDSSKHWRWPAQGKVLRTYEQSAPRQGIDIGGKLGSPVDAAEAGRVVYSGSGLKGYGKLIIIKHDDRFLTAYSFNRRLLVTQGDQVKAGQKIAEMGKGPHNENMLHFELRQDGQPVDPLLLLPSR